MAEVEHTGSRPELEPIRKRAQELKKLKERLVNEASVDCVSEHVNNQSELVKKKTKRQNEQRISAGHRVSVFLPNKQKDSTDNRKDKGRLFVVYTDDGLDKNVYLVEARQKKPGLFSSRFQQELKFLPDIKPRIDDKWPRSDSPVKQEVKKNKKKTIRDMSSYHTEASRRRFGLAREEIVKRKQHKSTSRQSMHIPTAHSDSGSHIFFSSDVRVLETQKLPRVHRLPEPEEEVITHSDRSNAGDDNTNTKQDKIAKGFQLTKPFVPIRKHSGIDLSHVKTSIDDRWSPTNPIANQIKMGFKDPNKMSKIVNIDLSHNKKINVKDISEDNVYLSDAKWHKPKLFPKTNVPAEFDIPQARHRINARWSPQNPIREIIRQGFKDPNFRFPDKTYLLSEDDLDDGDEERIEARTNLPPISKKDTMHVSSFQKFSQFKVPKESDTDRKSKKDSSPRKVGWMEMEPAKNLSKFAETEINTNPERTVPARKRKKYVPVYAEIDLSHVTKTVDDRWSPSNPISQQVLIGFKDPNKSCKGFSIDLSHYRKLDVKDLSENNLYVTEAKSRKPGYFKPQLMPEGYEVPKVQPKVDDRWHRKEAKPSVGDEGSIAITFLTENTEDELRFTDDEQPSDNDNSSVNQEDDGEHLMKLEDIKEITEVSMQKEVESQHGDTGEVSPIDEESAKKLQDNQAVSDCAEAVAGKHERDGDSTKLTPHVEVGLGNGTESVKGTQVVADIDEKVRKLPGEATHANENELGERNVQTNDAEQQNVAQTETNTEHEEAKRGRRSTLDHRWSPSHPISKMIENNFMSPDEESPRIAQKNMKKHYPFQTDDLDHDNIYVTDAKYRKPRIFSQQQKDEEQIPELKPKVDNRWSASHPVYKMQLQRKAEIGKGIDIKSSRPMKVNADDLQSKSLYVEEARMRKPGIFKHGEKTIKNITNHKADISNRSTEIPNNTANLTRERNVNKTLPKERQDKRGMENSVQRTFRHSKEEKHLIHTEDKPVGGSKDKSKPKPKETELKENREQHVKDKPGILKEVVHAKERKQEDKDNKTNQHEIKEEKVTESDLNISRSEKPKRKQFLFKESVPSTTVEEEKRKTAEIQTELEELRAMKAKAKNRSTAEYKSSYTQATLENLSESNLYVAEAKARKPAYFAKQANATEKTPFDERAKVPEASARKENNIVQQDETKKLVTRTERVDKELRKEDELKQNDSDEYKADKAAGLSLVDAPPSEKISTEVSTINDRHKKIKWKDEEMKRLKEEKARKEKVSQDEKKQKENSTKNTGMKSNFAKELERQRERTKKKNLSINLKDVDQYSDRKLIYLTSESQDTTPRTVRSMGKLELNERKLEKYRDGLKPSASSKYSATRIIGNKTLPTKAQTETRDRALKYFGNEYAKQNLYFKAKDLPSQNVYVSEAKLRKPGYFTEREHKNHLNKSLQIKPSPRDTKQTTGQANNQNVARQSIPRTTDEVILSSSKVSTDTEPKERKSNVKAGTNRTLTVIDGRKINVVIDLSENRDKDKKVHNELVKEEGKRQDKKRLKVSKGEDTEGVIKTNTRKTSEKDKCETRQAKVIMTKTALDTDKPSTAEWKTIDRSEKREQAGYRTKSKIIHVEDKSKENKDAKVIEMPKGGSRVHMEETSRVKKDRADIGDKSNKGKSSTLGHVNALTSNLNRKQKQKDIKHISPPKIESIMKPTTKSTQYADLVVEENKTGLLSTQEKTPKATKTKTRRKKFIPPDKDNKQQAMKDTVNDDLDYVTSRTPETEIGKQTKAQETEASLPKVGEERKRKSKKKRQLSKMDISSEEKHLVNNVLLETGRDFNKETTGHHKEKGARKSKRKLGHSKTITESVKEEAKQKDTKPKKRKLQTNERNKIEFPSFRTMQEEKDMPGNRSISNASRGICDTMTPQPETGIAMTPRDTEKGTSSRNASNESNHSSPTPNTFIDVPRVTVSKKREADASPWQDRPVDTIVETIDVRESRISYNDVQIETRDTRIQRIYLDLNGEGSNSMDKADKADGLSKSRPTQSVHVEKNTGFLVQDYDGFSGFFGQNRQSDSDEDEFKVSIQKLKQRNKNKAFGALKKKMNHRKSER